MGFGNKLKREPEEITEIFELDERLEELTEAVGNLNERLEAQNELLKGKRSITNHRRGNHSFELCVILSCNDAYATDRRKFCMRGESSVAFMERKLSKEMEIGRVSGI